MKILLPTSIKTLQSVSTATSSKDRWTEACYASLNHSGETWLYKQEKEEKGLPKKYSIKRFLKTYVVNII
jgi:hypothetical protein